MKYLVLYQWYENTSYGFINAENEEQAILKFAKMSNKLANNYDLENKYGYGESISPYYFDDDSNETFEEQFKKQYDEGIGGRFNATLITDDIEGIITEKFYSDRPSELGFYNGQDE